MNGPSKSKNDKTNKNLSVSTTLNKGNEKTSTSSNKISQPASIIKKRGVQNRSPSNNIPINEDINRDQLTAHGCFSSLKPCEEQHSDGQHTPDDDSFSITSEQFDNFLSAINKEVHQQLQDIKFNVNDVTLEAKDDDVEDNSKGISAKDGDHEMITSETTRKEHDADSVVTKVHSADEITNENGGARSDDPEVGNISSLETFSLATPNAMTPGNRTDTFSDTEVTYESDFEDDVVDDIDECDSSDQAEGNESSRIIKVFNTDLGANVRVDHHDEADTDNDNQDNDSVDYEQIAKSYHDVRPMENHRFAKHPCKPGYLISVSEYVH
jgi:hypothetical protein